MLFLAATWSVSLYVYLHTNPFIYCSWVFLDWAWLNGIVHSMYRRYHKHKLQTVFYVEGFSFQIKVAFLLLLDYYGRSIEFISVYIYVLFIFWLRNLLAQYLWNVKLNYNNVRMFRIEYAKKTKVPSGLFWPSQSDYQICWWKKHCIKTWKISRKHMHMIIRLRRSI